MTAAWTVFRKELIDTLRDRRTLFMGVLTSVIMAPLLLVALSALVAGMETRAERREIVVAGIEHAPTLRNYLERQTYTIKPAPEDFEAQLNSSRLGDPVLVIGPGFEAELARGESPELELVSSSANLRARSGAAIVSSLLGGFTAEQVSLHLVTRGVAPGMLQVVSIQERDLANRQVRGSRLTAMLPFLVLMAVAYGALIAALDTTAGERERGSLEPLLLNPVPRAALVTGKWGAAACVGMLIAALSCLSFLPGQWLLRSETLAAHFHFGLHEAASFMAVLAPIAAAISALVMAVAIRCKTYKEAQTNNTLVIVGVSLLPLVTILSQEGEQPWHLWVPVLAQSTLMNRVLKGETLNAIDVLIPLGVCALVAAAGIAFVAWSLRRVTLR